MYVAVHLLKKTYMIYKNYNKIHENLQVTYKEFEKITNIYKTYTNPQEKIEHHTNTMFKFRNKWSKNVIIQLLYDYVFRLFVTKCKQILPNYSTSDWRINVY